MKDKWNVNKLTSMLVQEEMRLKNQRAHSIHLLSHQEARKSSKRNSGKNKKGLYNLNDSSKAIHNQECGNNKCHFCHKARHLKKDCLKHKASSNRKVSLVF